MQTSKYRCAHAPWAAIMKFHKKYKNAYKKMRSGCAGNIRKKELWTFMDEGLANLPGGAAGGKIKKKSVALAAGPLGRRPKTSKFLCFLRFLQVLGGTQFERDPSHSNICCFWAWMALVFGWFCSHDWCFWLLDMNDIYFATKQLTFLGPQQHVNRDNVFWKHLMCMF